MPMSLGEVISEVAHNMSTEGQLAHLTKHVRALWAHVERLERHVTIEHNEVVIKLDSASIVLKKDGSVQINANTIVLSGAARVTVKAGSDLVLKGARIQQN
jgi:hypothetical protein